MNLEDIPKLFIESFMKLQTVVNRVLIAAWVWTSFYLAYKDTYTESPSFPEMLLFIIRFVTRPIEYVIDKLFYS